MNIFEMWKQLLGRYPTWVDPDVVVKLKARGLKALMQQAYDEGFKAGSQAAVQTDYTSVMDSLMSHLGKNKKF